MSTPQDSQAIVYGLAAVLLWSTVASAFKLGLQHLHVQQLLLLGTVMSWLVFAGYAVLTRQWRVNGADRTVVLLLGIINPWAYYLLLFGAYDRLPAHIAQPLNYTWAITLALLAVPILKQKLTLKMGAGIITSYAGVLVLLAGADPGEAGGWDYLGVALALGSTVLWAVYWLFNTRCSSPPVACMLWSFSIGLPLVFITCIAGPGLPQLTAPSVLAGAWVGLIEMGITFILWQQALSRSSNAARIGQLIFLSPFLSLIIIHYTLGEHITPGAVVGLVIIVAGLAATRTTQPSDR